LGHQVKTKRENQLDVTDECLALRSQLVLVFGVVREQGWRHPALVEQGVDLAEVGVIKLFIARKVLPEG